MEGAKMKNNLLVEIAKYGYYIALNIWRIFEILFRTIYRTWMQSRRYRESGKYRRVEGMLA